MMHEHTAMAGHPLTDRPSDINPTLVTNGSNRKGISAKPPALRERVAKDAINDPSARAPPGKRTPGKYREYGVLKKSANPAAAAINPSAIAKVSAIGFMTVKANKVGDETEGVFLATPVAQPTFNGRAEADWGRPKTLSKDQVKPMA